jgi:hypothetical protein
MGGAIALSFRSPSAPVPPNRRGYNSSDCPRPVLCLLGMPLANVLSDTGPRGTEPVYCSLGGGYVPQAR